MSELAMRLALEIAEAEQALRASAVAYGFDADDAVGRAKKLASGSGLNVTRALDYERHELADQWIREQSKPTA